MNKNSSTKTPSPSGASVLEVAMEFAFTQEVLDKVAEIYGPTAAQEVAMSTSVGGIGPLLRERVIAQAELGLNVAGVSLLYDTVWSQGWHVWNHLFLQRRSVGRYLRGIMEQLPFTLNLPLFDGSIATARVFKANYGAAAVYFLDCPEITDVVYPCPEDAPQLTQDPNAWAETQRLKQSWLVGRGALALAKKLNFRPNFLIQSETPTFFAHLRLIRDEYQTDPFFQETRCIFNDHTPLEYAHPIWPRSTLEKTKVDPDLYEPYLKGPGGYAQVDVTQLLVSASDGVFGVSKKHAHVMRAMPSLREYASKIQYVTNGVSRDLWQEPVFQKADELSDRELIEAKDKLKGDFVDWLWRRAALWPIWTRVARGKALVLWTRRITSYKRLDILPQIFNNPAWRQRFLNTNIILVVGGRVYQRDNVSEKMVYSLTELLNRDQELGDRVVFIQNFNVWEAPRLFHGADGAIMLSDDGREASATGFMKSQMNGGFVVANPDGAVPEFVIFKGQEEAGQKANGFGVAYANGEPDPESFLKALEDFDAVYRNDKARAAMMRAALSVTPQVSVERTARETLEFYKGLLKEKQPAS
ncbi:MAG: glycogen/starch/alpha-glucan phosphorylase [Elusimicrobia bacterium]|nr:glycogen/starch/alpha-glucan phosphorylase [Elusimicrobiota bacterium]